MKITLYDHRNGLSVVSESQIKDISKLFGEMQPSIRKNSVSEIREDIINKLQKLGWSGEYRLDIKSKITISSYHKDIGLCLQTGNVSRIYADLLKLQTLYIKNKIKAGIIIVPVQSLAVKLSSNMASFDRLTGELPIFNQVISMPIVVIGFDVEE